MCARGPLRRDRRGGGEEGRRPAARLEPSPHHCWAQHNTDNAPAVRPPLLRRTSPAAAKQPKPVKVRVREAQCTPSPRRHLHLLCYCRRRIEFIANDYDDANDQRISGVVGKLCPSSLPCFPGFPCFFSWARRFCGSPVLRSAKCESDARVSPRTVPTSRGRRSASLFRGYRSGSSLGGYLRSDHSRARRVAGRRWARFCFSLFGCCSAQQTSSSPPSSYRV